MPDSEWSSVLGHLLQDRARLRRALIASGESNVLQVGRYNIRIKKGQHLHIGDRIYQNPAVEMLRRAVRQVQAEIAADRYAASLQEYFRALRRYCASLPYLTLTDIRSPKSLDEVYIPLRVRQREEEASPRKPIVQGELLTIDQVLRQERTSHLLILGQPGAGKSTLLRQLAERAYDDPKSIGLERSHLPLLLPLRALACAEGALEERLNQALRNELHLTRALPDGFFEAWSQQLDAPWLFLLDQVPADKYLFLKQWLSDLLARSDIARVIITSRPSDYVEEEDTARFSVYEIQPFTPDQTAELACRWLGQETASAFLQALENMRSGMPIETPLLFTIAAQVYLQNQALPERRARLYQEFVSVWLEQARERGLRDELDAAVLNLAQPTLAQLALAMTGHPTWTDEKSLTPVVAKYLDEQLGLKDRAERVARRFLQVMARRSGVFLKRGERYEWVHPTFREYFAALTLNRQLENGKSFDEVLGEWMLSWEWAETISALAEVSGQPVALVEWLAKQAIEKQRGTVALLAWHCWKSCAAFAGSEAQVSLVDALSAALHDLNKEVRGRAAVALGKLGALAVEPLIGALGDPDVDVSQRAASALGETRDPRAVAPLVTALSHPDKDVRRRAARALGKIKDRRAVEPLVATLRDLDKRVRLAAAKALGNIGDVRVVEPLIATLGDTDADVRAGAAEALGQIGAPALEPLVAALGHPQVSVRLGAVKALGQIGAPHAVEALISLLHDPDERVRWSVAEALGSIGDARAVPSLVDALRTSSASMRKQAAEALGKIGDPQAVEPLVVALGDQNRDVRECAIEALVKIGAAEPLVAALHSLYQDVRYGAARALQRIGAAAVEPLIAALHDPDKEVRGQAAELLGQIGDPRAVEPLIAALRDPNKNVRGCVAEALGRTGDARAIEPLIVSLNDPNASVRSNALDALIKIGAPAVPALVTTLNSPNVNVRWGGVFALGKIGDARAVEPLLAALRDPNKDVRWGAAEALGYIGDARALFELERLAREDANKTVSDAAYQAIARIRARMEKTD